MHPKPRVLIRLLLEFLACAAVFLFGTVGVFGFAPHDISVSEKLNQAYSNQLLSYSFEAGDHECLATSVTVTGPQGAVPTQIIDAVYWPDGQGFVKSGRVVFLAGELKPLTTNVYQLHCSAAPPEYTASDLKVSAASDIVEIATSHIGVRLRLGASAFDQPQPLSQLPAPLVAYRMNDVWGGAGKFYGDALVRSFSSKLVESGPVLARAISKYELTDGNVIALTAEVVAGDNAVRWDLTATNDKPDAGIEHLLPAPPGVKSAVGLQGFGLWNSSDRVIPLPAKAEAFAYLGPDTSVIVNACPRCAWSLQLSSGVGEEVRLSSRDPAGWVDPLPGLTYGGSKSWNRNATGKSSGLLAQKADPCHL